jgi:hypothetical protein
MGAFKDFDQGVEEVEDNWAEFKYGGEEFKVNFNVPAGPILKWMRQGSKLEAIPLLLETLLPIADVERLIGTNANMGQLTELITWLAEELGGQGNSQD